MLDIYVIVNTFICSFDNTRQVHCILRSDSKEHFDQRENSNGVFLSTAILETSLHTNNTREPASLLVAPAHHRNGRDYLGAILIAPSSLITSPFSISFSMICFASAAYSSGRPRRGGNGTCWPSEIRAGSGKVPSKGVSKIPGAMVMTRMPSRASSRAMGKVIPTMPPLEAEYAACPICPSKAATDAVLMMTPRSPPAVGSFVAIAAAVKRIVLNIPMRFT